MELPGITHVDELSDVFAAFASNSIASEQVLQICRDHLRQSADARADVLAALREAVRTGVVNLAHAQTWCSMLGLPYPAAESHADPTLLRSQDRPPLAIGPGTRLLNGKFELQERLGGGGMGVVYRAADLEAVRLHDPNPYVALKILSPEVQSIPEATLALQREASRARRLDHSNIVRVYEFYQDRGVHFLTMELLQGRSWAELLREYPRGLESSAAMPLIEQLCAALTYAHRHGVVHSDLKPANLFLTSDQRVKVLDFGIAAPLRKAASSGEETRFNPRRLGALSESYACLEMWHGLDADPRDDVYSLACVIYELLSGRRPYGGATPAEASDRKLAPASIPTLSVAQNRALAQAMMLRRADRTASVDDFLKEFTSKRPRLARNRWAGVAAFIAVSAALCLGWLLMREPGRTGPHAISNRDDQIDGSQAVQLLQGLGIVDRRIQSGHLQSRSLLLDALRHTPRQVQLGSTAADLEAALALCRKFAPGCQPSWYADERLRTVVLRPFDLDVAPVTVREFEAFVQFTNFRTGAERVGGAYTLQGGRLHWIAGGYWRNAVGDAPAAADTAVVGVNYEDAERYCQWRGARLPTEDEWEYIARGPKRQIFPWGNDPGPAQSHMMQRPRAMDGPPGGIGGRYRGLAGNVWQWVATQEEEDRRVLKGASWLEPNPANLRATVRRQELPSRADSDTGFRCARSVEAWPDAADWLARLQ